MFRTKKLTEVIKFFNWQLNVVKISDIKFKNFIKILQLNMQI